MTADRAPVAVFVFKRPEHTRRTLEALARNPGFAESPLYVFCDGARHPGEAALVQDTRRVVQEFAHPDKTMIEAPANQGLARSIITGVSRLCERHGRVVVVEDDLIVAPVFLDYMNLALRRYERDEQVMQVSGHMFAVTLQRPTDAVFMPFTTSWGWATWSRAWRQFDPDMTHFDRLAADRGLRRRFDLGGAYPYFEMLVRQKKGLVDSWAIRWYLSVFMAQGLTLYPLHSLVANEGFDGTGTHGEANAGTAVRTASLPTQPLARLPDVSLDADAFAATARLLRSQFSLWRRVLRRAVSKLT